MMDIPHEVKEIRFDQGVPHIHVSQKEFDITISNGSIYNGAFKIKNLKDGLLKGSVFTRWDQIQFTPKEWIGNEQVILFRIDGKRYNPGVTIREKIVITSNGGEVVVPIQVRIIEPTLEIEDDIPIGNIEQFAQYAKRNWERAKEAFVSPSFRMWLGEIKKLHWVAIYEHLIMDTNKERALDNFLKVVGVKPEVTLSIKNTSTRIQVHSMMEKDMDYVLEVTKTGWGMIDGRVESSEDWIKLRTQRLNQEAFDHSGKAIVRYSIIPSKLPGPYVKGHIYIVHENQFLEYKITVIKKNIVEMRISKNSYEIEDRGKLMINNFSGEDIMIQIKAEEKWIEFEARKYLIGEQAEIPFDIHLTTWEKWKNQINTKKVPYYETLLRVQTQVKKQIVYKEFVIRACFNR